MITDAKEFGAALRRRRRNLGYTQAFLSEFSGFSVTFISDLENGKSTAELGSPALAQVVFVVKRYCGGVAVLSVWASV